jgi:hypothetical protein
LPQKTPRNRLLFSVVVLSAINILNFYDRHAPGALVEPMRKELHLNDTQIGLLASVLYLVDPKTGFETSIAALPFGLSSALELSK